MKTGARNNLVGTVTAIKTGDLMGQVKLDIEAGQMQSVMTVDSIENLDLKEGDKVKVIVKAINVLLVKE